jgi:hypothetical protein
MWNLSPVENYSLLFAVRTHSRPEEGDILKLNFLETPETPSFATMMFSGKFCPRLPEGLKKHR